MTTGSLANQVYGDWEAVWKALANQGAQSFSQVSFNAITKAFFNISPTRHEAGIPMLKYGLIYPMC